MCSNGFNVMNPIMSFPFSTSELVDNLLAVIQNIVAGTASHSMKMLRKNCVEWKVELFSNSLIIHLQCEQICDENQRVEIVPVIDYKVMHENSGTGDDVNVIKQVNSISHDERRENSLALYNTKQDIPELLLVLKHDEEGKDKNKEGNQTKSTCTGSVYFPKKNLTESVNPTSITGLIAVTASHSKNMLHTDEENADCDDQSKSSKKIGNDNEIGGKKGKRVKRKIVEEQRKGNHTKESNSVSVNSKKHPVSNAVAALKSGTEDDINITNHVNSITFNERRENSLALHNTKQEISKLLLVLNDEHSIDKNKEGHQKQTSFIKLNNDTESISHTMNNVTENVDFTSVKEMIPLTVSVSKNLMLQTDEEHGNCDDQSKSSEKIGNDNGIGGKKGRPVKRKTVKKQRTRNHTKQKIYISDKSKKHIVNNVKAALNLKMITLQTEEECGNGDDDDRERKRCERIASKNRISRKTGKTFQKKSEKEQHKRIITRVKPCIPGKSQRHLTSHKQIEQQKIHTVEKAFTCKKCGRCFRCSNTLTRHQRIHVDKKPFKCEICGKSFTELSSRNRHKLIHTGEKSVKCKICGELFLNSNRLSVHERIHTGEKPYQCEICGKRFALSGNLTVHERIHVGLKPFKCNVCDRSFTQKSNLKQHKRTHTGEKPFKCEICGKNVRTSSSLTVHMKIHLGLKPFKCDICDKLFTGKNNLKRHKRIHTGEKPAKCEICGKHFTTSYTLTIHRPVHTGEKPFRCEICGKSFNFASYLTIHKRIHTAEKPFKCKVCGKSFISSNRLTAHKRIHTGEKPFKCEICNRSFTNSSCLTVHERYHTGEKPYTCEICGKSFISSGRRTVHKKSHYGEKS